MEGLCNAGAGQHGCTGILIAALCCQAVSVPLPLPAAHPPVCRERSIRESHPGGPQLHQALATFRQVGASGACALVCCWPAVPAGVAELATCGLETAAVRPYQLSPPACAPTRLQEVAVIERALAPLLPALAAGPPPGSEPRPAYF